MSAPPTGTVTFLFTDIEGSTQRWENFPDVMAEAVARHDALLRAVIENNGGTVFKTIGDAFCAVFSSASEGVEAALEAQRSLAEQEWGEVAPLRVRMALHSGVALERDDDYFGTTVNRVARILGIGHGGQTLLSAATWELAQAEVPDEVSFYDFGAHRLKDLSRAEQIFGLLAPGLASEFPPLKSLNRQTHNLPVHPTPLIGRDVEVAQVLGLLREAAVRLVTLSGPGGTGKTRLSLQIAAESLDDFSDGIYFVSLAGASRTADIIAGIAQVVGLKEKADETPLDELTRYMRAKNALLVLDNFEQITESATLVADLLATCPGIKCLITSQRVLRLRGEREFAVQPLALPPKKLPPLREIARFPAIELFVSRAQAAKQGFELTPENAAAVVEICRRLDGLPLALELAAARIKLLAPQAMLGHLKNRLKLLTGGARDLPQRQRTLRDAIAWSHELLEESERVLLRRLAVFQGGCTLEAALAVGEDPDGPETDAFSGVEALVDKSLLRHEEVGEQTRFGMLEIIREYCLEQLAQSGEAESTQARHAEFFGQWMETLADEAKTNPSLSLEFCEFEHENLRAALDWWLGHSPVQANALAIALAIYWERQGHFREAREALARCLNVTTESVTAEDSAQKAKLLGLSGWFLFLSGHYENARDFQERCLALCRASGDPSGEADALNDLALISQAQGDAEQARTCFEDSLALVRQTGERPRQATRLSNLGLLSIEQERFEEAHSLLMEASAIYQSMGDQGGTAACLCNLGELALRRADFAEATALSQRSLGLFRELKDQRGIAYTLSNLAEAALESADFAGAIPFLEEALAIAWETEMQWLFPILLENLSRARFELDRSQGAFLALTAATLFRTRLNSLPSTPHEGIYAQIKEKLEAALGEDAPRINASLSKLDGEALIAHVIDPDQAVSG